MRETQSDPAAWDRLESLYSEVSRLPVGDRRAFLDRECAHYSDLRRELEELLACSDPAADFFDRFRNAMGDAPAEHADALAGTLVGRYRLESRLGAGGMG